METKSKSNIVIKKILPSNGNDYYLEVKSAGKAQKERSMKNKFEKRFEEELQKIKTALGKKGGVKRVDKVHQRIGRAKQKYPSVHQNYNIIVINDEINKNVVNIRWEKNEVKNNIKDENLGKYYIRTDLNMQDEVLVWHVYNTIREIESTFRILKTDLDLRPIYHKNDDSTVAHLNLGLLAYWLVNTIRCQLKRNGIHHNWKEITRIANTQKVITSGFNKAGKEITIRKCSLPEVKLKSIQQALKVKRRPFTKLKSVVHKLILKNATSVANRAIESG